MTTEPVEDDLLVLPLVTREEFCKIACNRCGDCCESLYLRVKDFEVLYKAPRQEDPEDSSYRSWLQDLIPITSVTEIKGELYRRYKCLRFAREADTGLGICTRYEERPWTCSAFPYGRPVVDVSAGGLPRCSWAVRIIDG